VMQLQLWATASDDGAVSKVVFLVDVYLLIPLKVAPYSTNKYNGVSGSHNLTAKAIDDNGATTTSKPVSIIVTTPPTVSITAPAANASFKVGETVIVTADAVDADGTVSSVEFFVDGVSIGIDNTAPYTINYVGVLGTHTFTAKATDNNGSQTTSSSITLHIIATGISDVYTSGSTFKVYPNPATDMVTLDVTASRPVKDIRYKIISMEGKVIIDKVIETISDKYIGSIDISSLAKRTIYNWIVFG